MKRFLRTKKNGHCKNPVWEGQILVEVMIAISITVISLIGFFGLLKSSLQLTRITANNYIATHLAVEGIEILANIIQENYINSVTQNTPFDRNITTGDHEIDFTTVQLGEATRVLIYHPLKFDADTKQYQYERGEDTPFLRVVRVGLETDKIHVTSTVYIEKISEFPAAQVSDTFQYWWRQ